MRSVTCTNNNGSTMTFHSFGFTPFILASIDGIYEHETNVAISQNTMTDGGTYQGSVANVRNIVLTLLDKPNNFYNRYNREALYVLFGQGKKGTLIYTEDNVSKTIDYYVEKITRETQGTCPITISMLCPDPFFYDMNYTTVYMANWISAFEFKHQFQLAGEELGYRSAKKIQNIVNDSAADNIGIEITIDAVGSASNITITRVESDKSITIGHSSMPFNMQAGDKLIITTDINNKHVYLLSNNIKREVNEYLTEDSYFIQLMRGDNNIGYSAESGEENLVVSIKYRFKYEGV